MSEIESRISTLLDRELARIEDLARRDVLRSFLQPPARLSLGWNYGHEGERINCWQVGRFPNRNILLVYCDRGFGPAFPWGFVFADEDSMGMDSQWHSGLEDAAIGAGMLPAPANYEVPGPRPCDDLE
jgi:hypothetical protein